MEYHTQYGLALKGKDNLRESASELLKAVSIVEEIRHGVRVKKADFYRRWLYQPFDAAQASRFGFFREGDGWRNDW